jgi:hypothetical protein
MIGVPNVTALIVSGAGTIQAAIEALRGDDCPDSQSFIGLYDRVSVSDRARLSVEEIFTVSGLSARRFVEIVTGALMQRSEDVTKMMVSVAKPQVVQATIKAAIDSLPILDITGRVVGHTNGDIKAMEIFHKATGFLPTPKGSTINLNQLNQTAQLGKGDDDEDCEPPQSADEYLMEIADVLRPKVLAAPPDSVMPINAPQIEYVDIEV